MPGALDGVRVLDWTHALAGPYGGLILADLGADVIKIENPDMNQQGDRDDHPFIAGESYHFMMKNRNKRSVTVNLKHEKGREAFYRLVKTADALIQNFRPGVAKRLGADYETLREINPGLVYCSVSGFGQGSPYQDLAGVDLIVQGMSGLMSITGELGGGPVKCGVAISDMGTGMYGAIGIMAALRHKLKTGQGQHVDVCLLDTPISWLIHDAPLYWAEGTVRGPLGSGHPLSVPYQAFRCSDDVHIVISAGGRQWLTFCEILGVPEIATDERFDTGEKRMRRRAELTEILQQAFDNFPSSHLLERFHAVGIACGPINTVDYVLDQEPHVKAKEMVVEVDHPIAGKVKHLGCPVKMSETPTGVWGPGPLHGQHTVDLMREIGYTDDEIEVLKKDGAI